MDTTYTNFDGTTLSTDSPRRLHVGDHCAWCQAEVGKRARALGEDVKDYVIDLLPRSTRLVWCDSACKRAFEANEKVLRERAAKNSLVNNVLTNPQGYWEHDGHVYTIELREVR